MKNNKAFVLMESLIEATAFTFLEQYSCYWGQGSIVVVLTLWWSSSELLLLLSLPNPMSSQNPLSSTLFSALAPKAPKKKAEATTRIQMKRILCWKRIRRCFYKETVPRVPLNVRISELWVIERFDKKDSQQIALLSQILDLESESSC